MTARSTIPSEGDGPRAGATVLWAIVLAGVLARLYNIHIPLFDWHIFRQFDTAALARNFYEGGMNILYPQVDWRGASPGYVEVEFQLYTYAVALLYHIFGPHEWVGRALNIGVYVLSAILLFRLTARAFSRPSAVLAVLFYSFLPLSVYQTRAFQPDALLALGAIAGVYFFWRWIEEERTGLLLLSAIGIAVAALIKPPSLYLGLPILYLAWHKYRWRLFRVSRLWLHAALIVVPVALWYWHAYGLWVEYGNTFGIFGRRSVAGIWPLGDPRWWSLAKALARRLTFEMATPPGLVLLGLGLVVSIRHRRRLRAGVLWAWLAGFAVFVLLVPRGHWGHDHYQLPAVFLTAAWMGHGARSMLEWGRPGRWAALAMIAGLFALSARQLRPMISYHPGHDRRIAFGERIQQLTDPDDLVVFVARALPNEPPASFRHRTPEGEYLYCDPIDFYLSRRKGWNPDAYQATPEFLERARRRGARWVATSFVKAIQRQRPDLRGWLDSVYTPVDTTDDWLIYRLPPPRGAREDGP